MVNGFVLIEKLKQTELEIPNSFLTSTLTISFAQAGAPACIV